MYRIETDHPSIAGHFPGQPVTPGVVILSHVLEHIQQQGLRVKTINQAKFLKLLEPGQDFDIQLTSSGERLQFEVHSGQQVIAKGRITLGVTD